MIEIRKMTETRFLDFKKQSQEGFAEDLAKAKSSNLAE